MLLNMEDQKKEEEKEVNAEDENCSEEFLIKHPLQNTWTLWYYENKSKDWEANQRDIFSFDTIEDFWSLYNHIKRPSELKVGCDYSLFKKGIRPMWEDAANEQGGRWVITLDKKQRNSELDKYWLEIILCMIGEAFDSYSDEISGAVVNVRSKGDKISLWTTNWQQSQSVLEIGRKVKEQLKIPKNVVLTYQSHEDAKTRSSSVTRSYYEI